MRRILVLFCIVLEMSVLKASNFFVDGLGYTFIKDGQVEVTDQCLDKVGYSGKLVIPAYVPYGGGMHKVTRIGDGAFELCHSLTSVTIPETVIAIGDGAFFNCSTLDSVVVPNSVLTIASQAFAYCTSLKSIVLSENLVVLGEAAFYFCYSLPSITIPNSVKYIGEYLTLGCDELKEIKIPAGVVFIGRNFWENVHVAYVANNVAEFCRSNGFNRSIHKGDGIIVDSVSYIIDGKEIEAIVIPNTVKTISEKAFVYCKSLKSVTILNGVETIGDEAFYGCDKLTHMILPESIKSVGDIAFYDTGISYVCSYASEPPMAESILFGGVRYYNGVCLYVPCESLNAYQQHPEFGRFQDIKCIEDYSSGARKVFYNNQVVTILRDGSVYDMQGRVLIK